MLFMTSHRSFEFISFMNSNEEQQVRVSFNGVYNFLRQIAAESISSQEKLKEDYKRVVNARKESIKKKNNIETIVKDLLQKLVHENHLISEYQRNMDKMTQQNPELLYEI